MNAAHWLWVGAGFMSFNEAVSSKCHAEFETEDQFRTAASQIANIARINAVTIDERFSSFSAIADFVVERALSSPDRLGPSWWGYEAGIALGLAGRSEEADCFLNGLSDERIIGRAATLLPLVNDPDMFRIKINEVVAGERARLKLDPLDNQAF